MASPNHKLSLAQRAILAGLFFILEGPQADAGQNVTRTTPAKTSVWMQERSLVSHNQI